MNRLIQEIQLADKYSRLKEDGTKETWPEVVNRVVYFLSNELLKMGKSPPSLWWEEIRRAMLNMEVLPSMRVVQMAGPALERDHVGAYNCLTGDTEYVTDTGIRTLAETVGTTQRVLTKGGIWRPATVRQFGEAPVNVITFRPGSRSRTSLRKIVRATADHGWLTTRGPVRDLQVGDEVIANGQIDEFNAHEWVRGFLFGDGTVQDNCTRARLCGMKAQYLPTFEATGARISYPESNDGDPTVSWRAGVFIECKHLPQAPSPSWMKGYLAADGYNAERQPTLSTTRKDAVDFIQRHAAELGVAVTGLTVWTKDSNFGARRPLYKLGIRPAADVVWRVLSIEPTDETVPVFCVTEPVTHTFTLAHGLTSLNCAYVALDKPSALGELLYIMMQGTGVGFSVEMTNVANWPVVQHLMGRYTTRMNEDGLSGFSVLAPNPVFPIEDSTEGWVDAYEHGISTWMSGWDVDFDFSKIRPAGAPLATKGGYASGPEPFRELLEFTRKIIQSAQGRKLTSFEIHRLATKAGSIVMVGGVRRAAQISLSDAYDVEMRHAKSGPFWEQYPELAMANNSAVIETEDQLAREWESLRNSGTGERGLFNPSGPIPERRDADYSFGTNPCGEILLRSRQFCNLSIAVARPNDTRETLARKVRIATLIGTIQSCLTKFPNLPQTWQDNCVEERLLGVDITGTMDCPLLQKTDKQTAALLTSLRDQAIEWNKQYAEQLGINPSAAVTCNKPSGNSSQLLDSSSGIHPRYARFYIRRLRIGRDTPLSQHLQALGIPVSPEVGQPDLATSPVWVFELPAQAPMGAVVRSDVSALDQLEYWKMWKLNWTEHNPSCTIYVGEDEWDQVYEWVRANWAIIGGLSFLPRNDHIYDLAPYEEIDEMEYNKRCGEIKWDGAALSAWAGEQAGSTDAACAGNFCEF